MKRNMIWAICAMLVCGSIVAQEIELPGESTPVPVTETVTEAIQDEISKEASTVMEKITEESEAILETTAPAEAAPGEAAPGEMKKEAAAGSQDIDSQGSPSDMAPKPEAPSEDSSALDTPPEPELDPAPASIEFDTEAPAIQGSFVDGPVITPDSTGVILGTTTGGIIGGGLVSDCVGCAPIGLAPPMTLDYSVAAPAPIYDAGVCGCQSSHGCSGCSGGCGECNSGCNSPCPTTSSCGSHSSCGNSACGSSHSSACGSTSRRGLFRSRTRLNAPCQGKCGCAGGGLLSKLRHRISGDRCRR